VKKIISSILIAIVILQLFAPFSVGFSDKKIAIENNIAKAAELEAKNVSSEFIKNDTGLQVIIKINFDPSIFTGAINNYFFRITKVENGKDGENKPVEVKKMSNGVWEGNVIFTNLTPSTKYDFVVSAKKQTGPATISPLFDKLITFTTSVAGDQKPVSLGVNSTDLKDVQTKAPGNLPACGIANMGEEGGTAMGCLAQGLYYIAFKPTSFFFGWAGTFLDFTLMYSISDSSYRSTFVTEGWGVVRDFCNMFFIFVLLYVAFGTILNLNGIKTKEMIVNVVIIGILINFSLFATQLIIDASNILTRVFYNQNTIATGAPIKDANGNTISVKNELGEFGQIKLSEAIVSKVDPQQLIMRASEVDSIPIRGTQIEGDTNKRVSEGGISTGSFILVILLATAVNVVGIMVFMSSGFIFVVRVITLWLAIILSPLAFFSYTVPEFQNMKTVGWKHWWSDTLNMAFLAPVFAFFMYIIVGFMDKGLGIVDVVTKKASSGLGMVIAIVVPFVFIMALLDRAKKTAKDMAGEAAGEIMKKAEAIGKTAMSIGGTVAGGAMGMGAGLLRGTVGNLGSKLANSKFASTNGMVGRGLGNIGKWASEGTMDIRGVKIAGKSLANVKGLSGIGKAGGQGGYKKYAADKIEKKKKRAEELEVHENEPLKQSINKTEMDLQALLNANKAEMDSLDKLIEIKRQALADANAQFGPKSEQVNQAGRDLQNHKNRKIKLRNGEVYDGDMDLVTGDQTTTNAKDYSSVASGTYDFVNENGVVEKKPRTITYLELTELKKAKQELEDENRKRRNDYANEIFDRWGSNINREAKHKIIMGSKIETKK